MSTKKVQLRFIDHIIDDSGNPLAHPTKEGQWARNGGQIPLVGDDGEVLCALPGDVFEVEPHIAKDLMATRPGVIVLESEFQKRAVKVESKRAADDVQRFALKLSLVKDKSQRAALIRMAAAVEKSRRQELQAQLASLDAPKVDPTELVLAKLAEMEKQAARDRADSATRIAALEQQLKAQPELSKGPAPKPEETKPPTDPPAEKPTDPGKKASARA